MKMLQRCFILIVLGFAFAGVQPVLAENQDGGVTNTTDGELGQLLSAELYCGTKELLEGNIGLAIGLLIMFSALWSLAKGGKMAPAVISLLFGAAITALPSLIEASMSGLAKLMTDTGMSPNSSNFTPPSECSTIRQKIDNTMKEVEKNRKLDGVCTGGYLDCS